MKLTERRYPGGGYGKEKVAAAMPAAAGQTFEAGQKNNLAESAPASLFVRQFREDAKVLQRRCVSGHFCAAGNFLE